MQSSFNFNAKTRFFNSIRKVDSELVKSSKDVAKLKAEYDYYYALPEDLKLFYVMPYKYSEASGVAQYCMEEFDGKNVADQSINMQLTDVEYSEMFLELINYRNALPVLESTGQEVDQNSYEMVLGKSKERVRDLRTTPWAVSSISADLAMAGITAESLYERLKKLYFRHYFGRTTKRIMLSHGDLTFSNILWNKERKELKLVDPRGVESMYLDEYYDLAKLSQSIFGRYDDIIYGTYQIDWTNLSLEFATGPNSLGQNQFIEYLDSLSINMNLLRVYEASLFLSMTPLHVEDHQRVASFLINCSNILSSIETRNE